MNIPNYMDLCLLQNKQNLFPDCYYMINLMNHAPVCHFYLINRLHITLFDINNEVCYHYQPQKKGYDPFWQRMSVCVCESYIVHHLMGTRLRCAPPTCIVHHGAQEYLQSYMYVR